MRTTSRLSLPAETTIRRLSGIQRTTAPDEGGFAATLQRFADLGLDVHTEAGVDVNG